MTSAGKLDRNKNHHHLDFKGPYRFITSDNSLRGTHQPATTREYAAIMVGKPVTIQATSLIGQNKAVKF